MPPLVSIISRPEDTAPVALVGRVVVVIDVLRATTTIVQALSAGARRVIPCLEIEDARRVAAGLPPGSFALGGERQGVRIVGFDLGNSPAEYTPAAVGGQTVIFTTTNGTRAMRTCAGARRLFLGAFLNRRALAARLRDEREIVLLCAGTDGEPTLEDELFAVALAEELSAVANDSWPERAVRRWRELPHDSVPAMTAPLRAALADSAGGRNLLALGYATDLDFAARCDVCDVVPEVDLRNWTIEAGSA